MNIIKKESIQKLGYNFVDPRYLPAGKDEYYLRNAQHAPAKPYRPLTPREIETLVKNANTSDDWTAISVTDRFDPELVINCHFFGRVRIGDLEDYYLEFHDLRLPVGLYHSTIVSCDLGNNVVIDGVRYLAHYIIGSEVILLNIDEMMTTDYAKFGNGIVKDGEPASVRVTLDVGNENGGRSIHPFDGMIPADAFLWAKYRDNPDLLARFAEMTDKKFDSRRGYYGIVGDCTIIKDCRILKDVNIGSHAYIKGANKLKNLTIHSTPEDSTQIGEGVELVNGVIGTGCRLFYGVKAVRFILGQNSVLKYGARLIHSFLGDNSTISCCEVLNSLIFPGHEQHHNNSFLCAAFILGQSNMAAGVSAGSNHNSRANDGELVAGRGFWPGLCASLKLPSRFASYTLIVKGAYPAELNIPLPFALVSNCESEDALHILPAFWFLYDMYALARNAWKYQARDARINKLQMIEFEALAPDSGEEIFTALALLETWTAKAWLGQQNKSADGISPEELRSIGYDLLQNQPDLVNSLEILGESIENSSRPVKILKTAAAWQIYRDMTHYYAVKTLVEYIQSKDRDSIHEPIKSLFHTPAPRPWVNIGGQLIPQSDLDSLKQDILRKKIDSWDQLHEEYHRRWQAYPRQKAHHAAHTLLKINNLSADQLTPDLWQSLLDRAAQTADLIAALTFKSREKDYTHPFRKITFDSDQEMSAVLGSIQSNDFIQKIQSQMAEFKSTLHKLPIPM